MLISLSCEEMYLLIMGQRYVEGWKSFIFTMSGSVSFENSMAVASYLSKICDERVFVTLEWR